MKTTPKDRFNMSSSPLYYSDYLELSTLLNIQHPKSFNTTQPAHDEMLFIIMHQAYELWFKQILFELDLVLDIFSRDEIRDNSPDMSNAVHRLKRIGKIFELVIHQLDVLETMTSLDFLEFRNLLIPASGFQSKQFRLLEVKLGLVGEQRHKGRHYQHTGEGGFEQSDVEEIRKAESERTLKELLISWLERMPFFEERYWRNYEGVAPGSGVERFWLDYKNVYRESLAVSEKSKVEDLDRALHVEGIRRFSPEATKAALFILLYRNLPIFHLPFELLNTLTEIDELISNWRHRHLVMVRRMIGMRVGTGGTSGAGYLEGTVSDDYYIFRELIEITTYLIERSKLPILPEGLRSKASFLA
jgi:tryptophan 2,3-dioxygenase